MYIWVRKENVTHKDKFPKDVPLIWSCAMLHFMSKHNVIVCQTVALDVLVYLPGTVDDPHPPV